MLAWYAVAGDEVRVCLLLFVFGRMGLLGGIFFGRYACPDGIVEGCGSLCTHVYLSLRWDAVGKEAGDVEK